MAVNIFPSLCPTDCNTPVNLPAIEVDQNCTSFDLNDSQLTDFWIVPDGVPAPFSGWVAGNFDVTAEPSNIDNSVTDNSKGKWLVVKGGVPVPDKQVDELPKNKDRTSKRTYTATMEVMNVSDAMYEFARSLQCGSTAYRIWYANEKHVFGKADGIEIKSIDSDLPLDEGRDGKERIIITVVYEAKVDPERRNKPTF